MMVIFEKEYDGESLYDVNRDVLEAFMLEYNPKIREIPCDRFGLQTGIFRVSITWEPES